MGAPSLTAALASTFWGSLASGLSPKGLFMKGLLSHAIIIVLMGFIPNLPLLLVLRIIQGVFGGISTLGLIIVSSSSSREWVSRDIGLFQNSMTLGQLAGPPIGALAATMLGYEGAFISASAFIFMTLIFCFFYVKEESTDEAEKPSTSKRRMIDKKTLIGWGLCFTATVQLMFLPSILPDVLQGFHMEESLAIRSAGMVVMLYTATAVAGTFLLCRLSARLSIFRLIFIAGILGTIFQLLLSLSFGLTSFVAIRMLQTAMIAAVAPLVFSFFASESDGRVLGFLNSSKFAGNALGPMIATSVVAFSSLKWVYISISIMGLVVLLSYVLFLADKKIATG